MTQPAEGGVTQVKIPSLGVSMTDGILQAWLVADGDEVAVGDAIYTVATDKIDQDIESPATGRITLIGSAGETYDVGTVVAEIR